jgi:hypothetical protein
MKPLLCFHWGNLPEAQVRRQLRHRIAALEALQSKIAKVVLV